MAAVDSSRSWQEMIRTFTLYFIINFASSLLLLHVTGNVLYSLLLLICYIFLAKFRNEYFSRTKGQWTLQHLVEELKSIDVNKRSFVIQRFVEIDRKKGVRQTNICEAERCVVCLDERAEIETLPCRHRVICGLCAWGTFKMALRNTASHTCVVCRSQIKDFNGSLFKNLVHVTWQDVRKILDETKAVQIQTHE